MCNRKISTLDKLDVCIELSGSLDLAGEQQEELNEQINAILLSAYSEIEAVLVEHASIIFIEKLILRRVSNRQIEAILSSAYSNIEAILVEHIGAVSIEKLVSRMVIKKPVEIQILDAESFKTQEELSEKISQIYKLRASTTKRAREEIIRRLVVNFFTGDRLAFDEATCIFEEKSSGSIIKHEMGLRKFLFDLSSKIESHLGLKISRQKGGDVYIYRD